MRVTWNDPNNKFQATICFNSKPIHFVVRDQDIYYMKLESNSVIDLSSTLTNINAAFNKKEIKQLDTKLCRFFNQLKITFSLNCISRIITRILTCRVAVGIKQHRCIKSVVTEFEYWPSYVG